MPDHTDDLQPRVRAAIRETMHEQGLTIAELARRSGIRYEHLHMSLAGHRAVSLEKLTEIAQALHPRRNAVQRIIDAAVR